MKKYDDIVKEIDDISKTPKNIILKASSDVIILKRKDEKTKNFELREYIDLENNNCYVDVYYDNLLYSRVKLISDDDIQNANIFKLILEVLKSILLS